MNCIDIRITNTINLKISQGFIDDLNGSKKHRIREEVYCENDSIIEEVEMGNRPPKI